MRKLKCEGCKSEIKKNEKVFFISLIEYDNELDKRQMQFDEEFASEHIINTLRLCQKCFERFKESDFLKEFTGAKESLEFQEKLKKRKDNGR